MHYNLTLDTAGGPWYDDLVNIFQGLHIVVSNGPAAKAAGRRGRRRTGRAGASTTVHLRLVIAVASSGGGAATA